MAINVSKGTLLKLLFIFLACFVTVVFVYATVTDGFPYRKEMLSLWNIATLVDIYIHVIFLAAWISYKQPDWISTILWIVLLVGLRSIATCLYVSIQFHKLSSKESTKHPIYHVLQRSKNKNGECESNIFTVVVGRVISGALSCLMGGLLIYIFNTAAFLFQKDVLLSMKMGFIDFYANLMPIVVWAVYKESSFVCAAIWIFLMCALGSVFTGAYIVFKLLELNSFDPMYLVLFNSEDRVRIGYERENYEKEDGNSVEEKP